MKLFNMKSEKLMASAFICAGISILLSSALVIFSDRGGELARFFGVITIVAMSFVVGVMTAELTRRLTVPGMDIEIEQLEKGGSSEPASAQ